MQIIPVLDLKAGLVVRGIAGRRSQYRPIVSRLTASTRPLDVARAFREQFGLDLLYLADLDAIAGQPPSSVCYRQLQEEGFRLWVDAGLRSAADAGPLLEMKVAGVIAGLETLAGPEELLSLATVAGPEQLIFSLDLKNGVPVIGGAGWTGLSVEALVAEVVACGIRRVIVLDLARVGVGAGTGTGELCRRLGQLQPTVEIIAGGGVRGIEDLRRLQADGVGGVLLASALHDGKITRADLRHLTQL